MTKANTLFIAALLFLITGMSLPLLAQLDQPDQYEVAPYFDSTAETTQNIVPIVSEGQESPQLHTLHVSDDEDWAIMDLYGFSLNGTETFIPHSINFSNIDNPDGTAFIVEIFQDGIDEEPSVDSVITAGENTRSVSFLAQPGLNQVYFRVRPIEEGWAGPLAYSFTVSRNTGANNAIIADFNVDGNVILIEISGGRSGKEIVIFRDTLGLPSTTIIARIPIERLAPSCNSCAGWDRMNCYYVIDSTANRQGQYTYKVQEFSNGVPVNDGVTIAKFPYTSTDPLPELTCPFISIPLAPLPTPTTSPTPNPTPSPSPVPSPSPSPVPSPSPSPTPEPLPEYWLLR